MDLEAGSEKTALQQGGSRRDIPRLQLVDILTAQPA